MASQVSLQPHPATPCTFVSTLTAEVDRATDDLLILNYHVQGDLDALHLPAQQQAVPADGLWHSTCFEAFIRPAGGPGYLELNLSPSGDWAVYWFDDYRCGMRTVTPEQPPKIVCRRHGSELDADIEIHLGGLGLPATDADLALAAVLHDQDGNASYWALAHPGGQPDFHDPEGFVLTLTRPGRAG